MSKHRELSKGQKQALLFLAALEFTAKLCALRDINRRDASSVRGRKGFWRLALVVNFFGPAAYFAFGRRD